MDEAQNANPQPLQHDLLCWAEAQTVLAFVLRVTPFDDNDGDSSDNAGICF